MAKQTRQRRAQAHTLRQSARPDVFGSSVRPFFIAEALENRILFVTNFLVTSTADSGDGSLRQAITSANETSGPSLIDFSIGSGSSTIMPLSPLPMLTAAITIDGTSQPGYSGTPLIDIDGSLAGSSADGFSVSTGGDCSFLGLVIDNFGHNGIVLNGTGGDIVQGDYLGVDPTGTTAAPNAEDGVVAASPNDLIGGPAAADRNLVSGNGGQGVDLYSFNGTGDLVEGNFIGTDLTGTAAIPNYLCGVCIYAANGNTVGGTASGDGNLISGNGNDGIVILGGSSTNVVEGNLMGTDVSGQKPLPNGFYGIEVDSGNNLVGGLTASARNIISGNDDAGVVLYQPLSVSNVVEGNYIGPDITGTQFVGIQPDGVDIDDGATNNTIGGSSAAAANVISGNLDHGAGFFGDGTEGNTISGNFIGTTANGMAGLGNGLVDEGGLGAGILAANDASGNTVGGTVPGSGNLISANGTGVILFGSTDTSQGNTIEGNFIGANAAGAGSLANVGDGVLLFGNNNTIGGTAPADANYIFCNSAATIVISYGTGNITQGNFTLLNAVPVPVVTLTTPPSGSTTSNNLPTFSGVASIAAGDAATVSVNVYVGTSASGMAIQTLTASWNPSDGSWSIPTSAALPDGTYTASASQSDVIGGIGYSSTDTFVVDTTPPTVTLTNPVSGDSTSSNSLTFSGMAGVASGDQSAITVMIYSGSAVGGTAVETLTTPANAGSYSTTAVPPLVAGTYTAVASQSDLAGNIGTSAPDNFTVVSTVLTVTLTTPSSVSTKNNLPTFSGVASTAAGDAATVNLYLYAGGLASGMAIQTLAATWNPATGSWSIAASAPLADGTYTALASQADTFGDIGYSTPDTFIVDTIAPTVTLTAPVNGVATNNNEPTFGGVAGTATGDLSAITVAIYSGITASGTPVQTLPTTASFGSYSVTASTSLPDGAYIAVASESDIAGNIGFSNADTFTIDTTAPVVTLTVPVSGSSAPNNQPTFGGIAGTATGDSASITVKIYGGSAISGTAVATLPATAVAGSYSVATSAALSSGTYTAVASQSDAAGNTGHSTADTFTIQSAAATPALLIPSSTSASTTQVWPSTPTEPYSNVFDGYTNTFWDSLYASGNWVQEAFSAPKTITSVVYAPRQGFEYRMEGGIFEASNDANFGTFVTLFTVPSTSQPTFALTTQAVNPGGAYQFVRYVAPPNSYGNIAEMQVFGTSASTGPTPVVSAGPTATVSAAGTTAALSVAASETGNPALTYTWSVVMLPTGVTAAPSFTASTNGTPSGNAVTASFLATGTYKLQVTITDPSNNSTVVPLLVTVGQVLSSIALTPSATTVLAPVSVPAGGTQAFGASGKDQFGLTLATQPTFTWSLAAGGSGSINATSGIYTASSTVGGTATVTASAVGSNGAVIANQAVVTTAASPASTPVTATPALLMPSSTSASTTQVWPSTPTEPYSNVFDGYTNTFWDSLYASGNWVQEAFSAPKTITSIVYAPRQGFEYRMEGGVFEASNDANFGTFVTLFTVPSTSQPTFALTTQAVNPGGAYQFVRYVAPPNSYGNIAEMQVFGTSASTGPTPVVSAGPSATVSAAGTTAALSVAASETGNPALTFIWSVVMLPTGVTAAPSFTASTNGTPSGNAVTASFLATGTYKLQVTITDPSNNSTVVPLLVTVGQVLSSIALTPSATTVLAPVSVPAGGTQAFGASGKDQFGLTLATQPTFTWSLAAGGSGSINATSGIYTASSTVGGTATVTASAVGSNGAVIANQAVVTTAASPATTPVSTTPALLIPSTTSASTTQVWPSTPTEPYSNVFDGYTNTFWDSLYASGNWVQEAFSAPKTITSIVYAPRQGFEYRMEGGVFEASNDANFGTFVTLFTVPSTSQPTFALTTQAVNPGGAYQFVRYVAPSNSYGNIAEMQVFGF